MARGLLKDDLKDCRETDKERILTRIQIWLLGILLLCYSYASGAVVEGVIKDMRTGEPLQRATVQLVASGRSTLANDNGEFRLILPPGEQELKFSHIGYHSQWKTVQLTDSTLTLEISLPPTVIELKDVVVESYAYDAAQGIIVEAIKRKQQILRKLHDYSYDAYSKLIVRDISKDTAKIILITESQSTSYWEYPDKYKEILTARRQSANLPAEANLVVVGNILNFNKNRLEIDKWEVVSPTAEDALDHYNYYLLDSTLIDNRKVYRLRVEPRSESVPLVVGQIQIVDSTFDVVGVDVGFNDVIDAPYIDSIQYHQQSALFANEYWMPVNVGFKARVDINFPGVPSPLKIDYEASLHSYSFETGAGDEVFDEYALEVDKNADKVDSAAWALRQAIPLTRDELHGYEYIDSVEHAPKPLRKIALHGLLAAAALITVGDYDFFHFQRVDGPYLGARLNLKPLNNTDVWLTAGYGFDSRFWRHRYGVRHKFDGKLDLSVSAQYRRQFTARSMIGKDFYNPTFEALFFKYDPFDYHREEGYSLFADMRLLPHVRAQAYFNDVRQESAEVVTDYSFFGDVDEPFRSNPPIAAGHLREVGGALKYDSRQLWRNKGVDMVLDDVQYTTLELGASYSSPKILDSDFDYRKYYVRLHHQRRMLGIGVTSFDLFAGSSTRALPPQEYYTFGFDDPFVVGSLGFLTVGDTYFYGNRALLLHLNHEFGKDLWLRSGIPVVRNIPFTLGISGGIFWSKFEKHTSQIGDEMLMTAEDGYSEIGFSVGNLTPFIWPLNLAVYCTWQLSAYDTNHFSFMVGVKL